MSLLEIQEKVDLVGEPEDLSEEQEEELPRELNGHRELKQTGACASNISAAQDLRQTMERTATEVSIFFLSDRESRLVTFDSCNTCPVASAVSALLFFVTRAHVQDQATPGFVVTGNASEFIQEVFGMPPSDLLLKFEQWVCAHDPDNNNLNK